MCSTWASDRSASGYTAATSSGENQAIRPPRTGSDHGTSLANGDPASRTTTAPKTTRTSGRDPTNEPTSTLSRPGSPCRPLDTGFRTGCVCEAPRCGQRGWHGSPPQSSCVSPTTSEYAPHTTGPYGDPTTPAASTSAPFRPGTFPHHGGDARICRRSNPPDP